MKLLASAVVILGAASGLALAQAPAPEPTRFEAFISHPNARVRFVKHVGSIHSSDAIVRVAALIVEDIGQSASQMRGVRLALQNNTTADQVYLDEAQLTSVKKALAVIEQGIPALERGDGSPYRVQGTESCWTPDAPVRILCPDYYIGPDGSALRLRASGGPMFQFPNRRPSELIELIDRALAELQKR